MDIAIVSASLDEGMEDQVEKYRECHDRNDQGEVSDGGEDVSVELGDADVEVRGGSGRC